MSFDLYFCRRPGDQIDPARVQCHMNDLEYMTESQSDDGSLIQFEYSNPATDVYCLFDMYSEAETEAEEALVLPENHISAGLSVSVNFLRPHFFALESMPMVSGIADSFSLSIYDPQADQIYAPGTNPEVLILSWIKNNEKVTRGLAREKEPIRKPYLPMEQSLYWWRYTRAREDFQDTLKEDVFVPSIFLMADADDQVRLTVLWSAEVQRRTFWPSRVLPLPQVFPVCDYLMLAWGKPEAERLDKAIVSYPTAMASMVGVLDDISGPVEGLRILRPEKQSQASEVFDALPKRDLGSLKLIAAAGFVDVCV